MTIASLSRSMRQIRIPRDRRNDRLAATRPFNPTIRRFLQAKEISGALYVLPLCIFQNGSISKLIDPRLRSTFFSGYLRSYINYYYYVLVTRIFFTFTIHNSYNLDVYIICIIYIIMDLYNPIFIIKNHICMLIFTSNRYYLFIN